MRVHLVAVGKLKSGPEREIFERYWQRLEAIGKGVGLGALRLTEIPESRARDAATRKREEAHALATAAGGTALRVALDERGKALTTAALAAWINGRRESGEREVAFLIGGADGHDPPLRSDAGLVLSLSALTLPHGLARLVIAEQLYRVATLLSGHPYHRE